MKKYKLYRSLGDLDQHVRQHELVAIENGKDIFSVTDSLIHAVIYKKVKNTATIKQPLMHQNPSIQISVALNAMIMRC